MKRSEKYVSGLKYTGEQGTNPKDELGTLKTPLALVSPTAATIMAICMADGEEKYGPYNYRVAKVQARVYLEACLRHVFAILDGQDFDSNTGKPHIGYALSTLQIYCDAWVNGNLIDNRPVPGKAGAIMDWFARTPTDPEKTPTELEQGLLDIINPNPGV
jgi:hypothetical protein